MFCKYCGKVIDDDSVFCDGCGKNLKETGAKTVYVPTTVKDNSNKTAPEAFPKTQYTQPVKPKPVRNTQNEYVPPVTNQATPKPKRKKNIAPYILLPISMLVAGLISSLINALFSFSSLLTSFLGVVLQDIDATSVISATSYVGTFVGSISYVVVIALFSLVCKGLQKKLHFIMSIYITSIAAVVNTCITGFTYGLLAILSIDNLSIEALIQVIGSIIGVSVYFVLAVPIAIFVFKYISSFTEKEIDAQTEAYKVKLLIPSIIIAGYGILEFALNLIPSFVGQLFTVWEYYYISLVTTQAIYTVIHVVTWGILIGVAFIIKDKYQRFTLVGSVIAGSSIVGFVGSVINFITIFLPETTTVVGVFSSVVTTALGIGAGILIYYLANKKQYVKIKA